MLNHIQTLLLNRDPKDKCFEPSWQDYVPLASEYVGSELLVDRTYQVRHVSPLVQSVQSLIFGNSPDWFYASSRCSEIWEILRVSRQREKLTKYDSRLTRADRTQLPKVPPVRWQNNTPAGIELTGKWIADDVAGRSLLSISTTPGVPNFVVNNSSRPDLVGNTYNYRTTLPGTGIQLARISATATTVQLSLVSPPGRSWGELAARLSELSDVINEVLSERLSEQQKIELTAATSFRSSTPQRLAGWLFAIAEYTSNSNGPI